LTAFWGGDILKNKILEKLNYYKKGEEMMLKGKLLYLNWEEMDSLGLSLLKITDGVEKAFIDNAAGNVINPPKHWIQTGPDTWFGGMSCYIPSLNGAGIKWQSGNPKNEKRGSSLYSWLLYSQQR